MTRQSKASRTKRMRDMVAYMQRYVVNYTQQESYETYSDETFLDDMLYGLGVALNEKEHSHASGYDVFKEKLLKHLKGNND